MSNLQGKNQDDLAIESALRPTAWNDYIGQEKIKENIQLILRAAKERKENCEHLLFYGQAGLGKTTLAYIIGKEMGVNIRSTAGPMFERAGDVAAILSNLEPYELLFIDEIHRLNKIVEEVFYPALESRKLHLVVGKGPSAKTVSLTLPPFTMIGATTKISLLSSPLRTRFGACFKLDYYSILDIGKIIKRAAGILGVRISEDAIQRIAKASRFTPRVANRLLRRARDYAQVYKENIIDDEAARQALEMLDVDELGLERADRRLLEIIINKFGGGPVGLDALGAALNEESETIADIYEPYLMGIGFLERTRLGRVVSREAYKHLGIRN